MPSVVQIRDYPDFFPMEAPRSRFEDEDYLAVMCHEIGTPLTSIVGLSYVLASVDCSPQRKAKCAEMLRDSSNMLMELMKNMLDASRIGAGRIEIENIDFDPARLVQEVANIISTKVAEKELKLHVHITNGLPSQWLGDPLRIRQILLNLLSNAVKFTEKGQVSLHVNTKCDEHGNDQLCITVADTGIGMSEAALKKIFDRYVQADASINRKYGGTGLGLSISRDLAHLMHGDIAVKSWPSMGSHFTLTLPLAKAAAFLAAA